MRYASAAAAERRSAVLARKAEKTVRKRRDKCIRTLEPQHLNGRVLIRKRPSRRILSCQTWIGFSENASPRRSYAKTNHRPRKNRAAKPPFLANVLRSRRALTQSSVAFEPDLPVTALQNR